MAAGSQCAVVMAPRDGGEFAAVCNAGAAASGDSDLLAFLDPGAEAPPGWLDALAAALAEDPGAAVAGPKLLHPDGSLASAGIAIGQDLRPRHLYAGFAGDHPVADRPRRVVAVAAACLLVRRDAFERAGGFDRDLAADLAVLDLCLRLGAEGHATSYCPRSEVRHPVAPFPDPPAGQGWEHRLRPDDLGHYLADGLLSVAYSQRGARLSVSPPLAVSAGEEEAELARLLAVRSRQVMELRAGRGPEAPDPAAAPPAAAPGDEAPPAPAGVVVHRGSFQALGAGESGRRVSVLMPVKDAAPDLRLTLPLLRAQQASAELEIVAIDSGSSDETVEVLAEFGATVVAIEPEQFDHGLTRNLLAEHARAETLVFLNARSRPVGERWLAPLLAALDADPEVAGACSRVLPHADADLLTRREVELEPSGSERRAVKRIENWEAYRAMPVEQRRLLLNFHTVSTAIRADVLRRIPFRSVRTIGEDLLWAREVLEAGLALVHEPGSEVHHSHDYSLRELFMRNVDDGIANRDINERIVSERELAEALPASIASDWHHLRAEAGIGGAELDRWQIEASLRRVAQWTGQWLGTNHADLPADAVAPFSRVQSVRRPRR